MINPHKINPLNYLPQEFVFSTLGFASTLWVAHYGPGQTFNTIVGLAKKHTTSLAIILVNNALMSLIGHNCRETLSNSAYPLALGIMGSMVALPLIYCSSGRVAAGIKNFIKHPVTTGITGALAGYMTGMWLTLELYEPDNTMLFSIYDATHNINLENCFFLLMKTLVYANVMYFLGRHSIEVGSGQATVSPLTSNASVTSLVAGEIAGLLFGIGGTIAVYPSLAPSWGLEYDAQRRVYVFPSKSIL
jgi:hypothetical protein